MPRVDLSPDQRGAQRTAARIRRELPPGVSGEVRKTRIGPAGPSGEALSTRIGPGPSGEVLDTRIGGPQVADYFQFGEKIDGEEPVRPVRINDLPLSIDPQTTEEA